MENNRKLSASCPVIKDDQVLLVKHTYTERPKASISYPEGSAKRKNAADNRRKRSIGKTSVRI